MALNKRMAGLRTARAGSTRYLSPLPTGAQSPSGCHSPAPPCLALRHLPDHLRLPQPSEYRPVTVCVAGMTCRYTSHEEYISRLWLMPELRAAAERNVLAPLDASTPVHLQRETS